jgi:hypothetical protein
MYFVPAFEASKNLYRLIQEVGESCRAIKIIGRHHRAVLVSEKEWARIQRELGSRPGANLVCPPEDVPYDGRERRKSPGDRRKAENDRRKSAGQVQKSTESDVV